MTITLGLSAIILLAVWLILMGLSQLGVVMPRWVTILMGILALCAGVLFLVGKAGF